MIRLQAGFEDNWWCSTAAMAWQIDFGMQWRWKQHDSVARVILKEAATNRILREWRALAIVIKKVTKALIDGHFDKPAHACTVHICAMEQNALKMQPAGGRLLGRRLKMVYCRDSKNDAWAEDSPPHQFPSNWLLYSPRHYITSALDLHYDHLAKSGCKMRLRTIWYAMAVTCSRVITTDFLMPVWSIYYQHNHKTMFDGAKDDSTMVSYAFFKSLNIICGNNLSWLINLKMLTGIKSLLIDRTLNPLSACFQVMTKMDYAVFVRFLLFTRHHNSECHQMPPLVENCIIFKLVL